MRATPTLYATSGDVRVAYQVTGTADVDLVLAPGTISHLELSWEFPPIVRLIEELSSFSRLIRFDKRGTGLSDRPTDAATIEERTDDIRAVMDAAGSERAFLLGASEGAQMAAVFAATYPERTRGLLVWGGAARWTRADDYPWGGTRAEAEANVERLAESWPPPEYLSGVGVGLGAEIDAMVLDYYTKLCRYGASPAAAVALERMNLDVDVRDVLPTIRVPTLVMNRTGDPMVPVDAARDLAARIPGARFVEFPGATHLMFFPDLQPVIAEIRAFVTGTRSAPASTRVLATIAFFDVVGSTELAARLGDAAWRNLLDDFYAMATRELTAFGGVEVDRAGDGLLATFDGPTRAIRCGAAIQEGSRPLGLTLRGGVHTGEVERTGDGVRGIAVHVAARVAALAGPDELLASSTVRDLSAGSGLEFEDRGTHALKGVPEPRRLFAVRV